jgi:CRISPR/Cas system Type II protein with McrA/HNH and RuvC-like nuclease domain
LDGSSLCALCYCKEIAYHRLGTRTHAAVLLERFTQQGGKCALSGSEIFLGRDAELDHIVPRARGGSDSPENTQWVLCVVNRMKDHLLEDEFFDLIKRLYTTMKATR